MRLRDKIERDDKRRAYLMAFAAFSWCIFCLSVAGAIVVLHLNGFTL